MLRTENPGFLCRLDEKVGRRLRIEADLAEAITLCAEFALIK